MWELLRDAIEVVPGLAELELEGALAGLRPGTPDNAPAIGPATGVPGLIWAAGHHRNGVLLAPLTADAVVAELAGEAPPPGVAALTPSRFAELPV